MKEKEDEQKQGLLSALKNGGKGETWVFKNSLCLGKLVFGVSKIKESIRVYPYFFKKTNTSLGEAIQAQNDLISFVEMVKNNHFYVMLPSIESGIIGYKTKTKMQLSVLIQMVNILHSSWKEEKKHEAEKAASTERIRKAQMPLVRSMGESFASAKVKP